jgi:flagellar export protein FliJ
LAKFQFNLETLLRHREDIEQKERDELFRLTYKYQLELSNRDHLTGKFQETMNELSLKQAENSVHRELTYFYLYLKRLNYEIGECEKRLCQLQSEVQAQKEVVIEASKKRKTLATMKGKKEKEHILASEKQEQKEIDELVVTRYTTRESDYPQVSEIYKGRTDLKHE